MFAMLERNQDASASDGLAAELAHGTSDQPSISDDSRSAVRREPMRCP
jgi:hypothetical protein